MERELTYKGIRIIHRGDYVLVCAWAWGDQPGEDRHHFKQLKKAKAFIDRMKESGQ